MSAITTALDRRKFLKTSLAGATGLIVGFYLPGRREVLAADGGSAPAALNAFVHVSPEDKVTILISKSEMGQSVVTSLSMLAAEELECDWQRIHWEFAPADKVYFDPAFGMQGTGGSQSIHSGWIPMRAAGLTARVMLITAAAQKWGVDASECHAENGKVIHSATKRSVTYGSVADAAGKLPQPQISRSRFNEDQAEGSEPVQGDWQADKAARYAGQGERQGDVRHRRAASGNAARIRRALPCLRGQSRQL